MSAPIPGSILVTSDAGDAVQGDSALLNPTTGTVLSTQSFIYARSADRVPSGVNAIGRQRSSSDATIVALDVYDTSLTLVASITSLGSGNPQTSPIGGNTSDSFYIAITPFGFTTHSTVYRVSSAGVLDPTSWSIPTSSTPNSNALIGIAPSADNRWLYYTVQPPTGDALLSFDLINNVPGPTVLTLAPTEAFIQPGNLLMLPNGNLLVFVATNSETAFEVRQVTTTGVLVRTYPLAADAANGDAPELFRDYDPEFFWMRTFPDGTLHTSLFTQYSLTTGLQIVQWTSQNLNGSGQVPATCPNIVMGPEPPGTAKVGQRQTVPIKWVRRTSQMSDELLWLFFSEFQLMFQPGVGQANDPGANPQIGLRWSNDGGNTWSNQRWVSAGLQGQYGTRAIWRMLGRARNRVWELTSTDPVVWAMVDAFATVEKQA